MLYAITDEALAQLEAQDIDQMYDYMLEEIEEELFDTPEAFELDKAWEGIHYCLCEGAGATVAPKGQAAAQGTGSLRSQGVLTSQPCYSCSPRRLLHGKGSELGTATKRWLTRACSQQSEEIIRALR